MNSKLESAIRAAQDQDDVLARRLLRKVLQEEPGNELAWLWSAELAQNERERRICLRQALRINPENTAAARALASPDRSVFPEGPPPAPPQPESEPTPLLPQESGLGPEPLSLPEEFTPLPAPPPMSEAVQPDVEEVDETWLPSRRRGCVAPIAIVVVGLIIICFLAVSVLLVPQLTGEGPLGGIPATEAPPGVTATDTVPPPTPEEGESEGQSPAGGPTESPEVGPLPDLVISQVRIELEAAGACFDGSTPLGTRVWIENAGEGDAGPFVVEVNGEQAQVTPGLAAGEGTMLWFADYVRDMETIVVLDVEEEVAERDEGDNIFALMVPIPTPPPPCTPLPDEGAPPVPGEVSIANVSLLAPLRISSRSVYSSDPSSYLQVEMDAAGNARIIKDVPGAFEEWYTIDGEVFAGEAPAEGLEPFQPIEEPETVAGFSDPTYIFAPGGETDRTTPAFPLHAVLWSGVDLVSARASVSETLQGLTVEKLQVAVEPELVPESIRVTEDKVEDLRAAIEAGEGNEVVYVWIEPESGAIVKAEWNVIFADGEKALFTVDMAQAELKPVALPTEAALPNPASQHCVDQGYELQIREEVGGQVGYCVFPDGSECEEWAFYREECAVGENYP